MAYGMARTMTHACVRSNGLVKQGFVSPTATFHRAAPITRQEWRGARQCMAGDWRGNKPRPAAMGGDRYDICHVGRNRTYSSTAMFDTDLKEGHTAHFGRIFQICPENAQEHEPQFRKYEGRVIFQRNQVTDQPAAYAAFQELGSPAPLMSAAQLCGCHKPRVPESNRTHRKHTHGQR